MDPIEVLIVDDEPLARIRIRTLLEEQPFVEVIGEAENGTTAIQSILDQKPDILFLDIQMPELDGFEVLSALSDDEMPIVIFVTAFEEFALQAFEAHALDYLLKPFDDERLLQAFTRAKSQLQLQQNEKAQLDFRELIANIPKRATYQEQLAVRLNERVILVKIEMIDWIESSANYVKLHIEDEVYLFRETMSGMEQRLNPTHFTRIHRSTIVNLDRIKEFQPWSHGDYIVILKDGQKLKMSRNYGEILKASFGSQK
jgi:two-component system LytT family response regulator